MVDLFSGMGANRNYVAVRDQPRFADIRQECQRLWNLYEPLAPSNFVDQFSRDFDSRFWEMDLGATLLKYYPRLTSSSAGPDFIELGPPRVAVEATVATRGEGPDAVPDITLRTDDDDSVPFNECVLRLTAALRTKATANSAVQQATLGPYVVAVNMPYPEAWLCGVPPISAMAMLGCSGVTTNLATGVQTASAQWSILKRSDQPVPTIAFFADEYVHISALLVASMSPFSSAYPTPAIELLHNPRCRTPLPRGWLPVGNEYWVDGEMLVSRKHCSNE